MAADLAEQTQHDITASETVLRLNLLRNHEVECARLRKEIAALTGARSGDADPDKESIRERHRDQRAAILKRKQAFLHAFEDYALTQVASGDEIDPARIEPEICLAQTEEENNLFAYAALHWSVPVSGGYGRRSRFLVRDKQNQKLVGVFALSDPVYNLSARDDKIGWTDKQKQILLYRVLDASVIGALPPYSQLLGGKLVALSVIARETLDLIEQKYRGKRTRIAKRVLEEPRPVLITTTSALGPSSIYNRLRKPTREFFVRLGWTLGYGHFEIPDELFARLVLVLREVGNEKAQAHAYGQGPSWRMRTIRIALEYLGIEPDSLLRHGIKREVFAAPTAKNWREILLSEQADAAWFDDDLGSLGQFYRERWAIPRAARRPDYRDFKPETLQLRDVAYKQMKLGA